MKKYLVAVLLIVSCSLTGCLKFENIELVSIKNVTYKEFKNNVLKIDVEAVINNPNRFKVKIKEANLDLMFNDQVLGSVTQLEQIELAGGVQNNYTLQIAVEMKDLQSNLVALFRLLMNESKKLNLSGTLHVKSFLFTKTVYLEKITLQ